eukprot:scaffold1127_cov93-Isochrysis_galbana.AAC.1
MYDVPSIFPADGRLAAVKLICALHIKFPIVAAWVTVTGEELFLYYNGTEVGTLMLRDLDVARGGASLSTTADLILTLSNPAAAREMGTAAMSQRELHVQMAGTLRIKILGDKNGCFLKGSQKRFCVDGWIPSIHVAKVRAESGGRSQAARKADSAAEGGRVPLRA